MTTRRMLDCMHVNVNVTYHALQQGDLVGLYVTGSPDIRCTSSDEALFTGHQIVTIDQGFTGSPVLSAVVRDVETGAWTPGGAVRTDGWTAERKTIYCSRSTLGDVIAHGWKGDVWLAWPGYSASFAPKYPGVNVVAVQNFMGGSFDSSTIYDATWPKAVAPAPVAPHSSLTVNERIANLAFPRIDGADHYTIAYRATRNATPAVLYRPPQPAGGDVVHMHNIHIPGGYYGEILITAIVHSQPHLVDIIALH
jgi:hypothetical protein